MRVYLGIVGERRRTSPLRVARRYWRQEFENIREKEFLGQFNYSPSVSRHRSLILRNARMFIQNRVKRE